MKKRRRGYVELRWTCAGRVRLPSASPPPLVRSVNWYRYEHHLVVRLHGNETYLSLRNSLITVLDKTRLFALPLIFRSFRFGRVGARLTTPCLLFYQKLVSFLRESSLYNPLVRKTRLGQVS